VFTLLGIILYVNKQSDLDRKNALYIQVFFSLELKMIQVVKHCKNNTLYRSTINEKVKRRIWFFSSVIFWISSLCKLSSSMKCFVHTTAERVSERV